MWNDSSDPAVAIDTSAHKSVPAATQEASRTTEFVLKLLERVLESPRRLDTVVSRVHGHRVFREFVRVELPCRLAQTMAFIPAVSSPAATTKTRNLVETKETKKLVDSLSLL